MITARLLLMPVLKSVELKVVLWAKAGTVLRANSAATVRSGRSRERIFFGASIFFMALLFSFLPAVHPPSYAGHPFKFSNALCLISEQNEKIFLAR
jgi:hypothetical protein